MKKTVLVVDDEKKIVQVLTAYLLRAGYNVLSGDNGRDALELMQTREIDLVLLDLMLPGISGEEICRLNSNGKKIPLIMITAKNGEGDMIAGLRTGADDYIVKPFSPGNVLARIESVLRRADISKKNGGVQLKTIKNECLELNTATHTVTKDGTELHLTPAEFSILELFMKNPKVVFSRQKLLEIASGTNFDVSDRIIDAHIKSIRKKIEGDRKNPALLVTVHGLGYKFCGNSK